MADDLDRPDLKPGLPADSVLLEQDFDVSSLYSLRAAVAAHGARVGLTGNQLYDVVTVAHELAANAVRHGAGHGRLRLGLADGVLRCEVSDDGRPPVADSAQADDAQSGGADCNAPEGGIAASVVPAARDDPKWPEEHGHGLWVIGQVADQFTIDRSEEATTATAAFTLGARAKPDERAESATAVRPDGQGRHHQ
jgi:anti-sigma regulatory factor (Ser/Thr protein kinase)